MARHTDTVRRHLKLHKKMAERLEKHDPKNLPEGVDTKKLEDAYKRLEGYELVLRKKKQR